MTLRVVEPIATDSDSPAPQAEPNGELVAAARSGDRAAAARLYKRFAPMVHAILLARVDPADADDLTQEVFIRALRRLDSLRDPDAVGAWLATMARHEATSLARWRHRMKRLLLVRAPAPRRDDHGMDSEQVLAAVRRLPESYRETLLMRLVAGLSGAEIAARTGLGEGSVRVNLTRGMKLLRAELRTETDR